MIDFLDGLIDQSAHYSLFSPKRIQKTPNSEIMVRTLYTTDMHVPLRVSKIQKLTKSNMPLRLIVTETGELLVVEKKNKQTRQEIEK